MNKELEVVEQFAELGKSIHALVEQGREDKRILYRIIVILIIMFFVSLSAVVGGFLWYLNQYDFVSYDTTYEQSTEGGGDNSFIGGDGDILNGETDSTDTY